MKTLFSFPVVLALLAVPAIAVRVSAQQESVPMVGILMPVPAPPPALTPMYGSPLLRGSVSETVPYNVLQLLNSRSPGMQVWRCPLSVAAAQVPNAIGCVQQGATAGGVYTLGDIATGAYGECRWSGRRGSGTLACWSRWRTN